MIKRSGPIKRYTPVRKKKARSGDVTVGKLGRVRLRGKALEALRRACFERDGYRCVECRRCGLCHNPLDMAHIQSRGAGGSDTLENVKTLCHECHMKSHNAGGKPCPPKPKEIPDAETDS